MDSLHCQIYLFSPIGGENGQLEIGVGDKPLELGNAVDGPGRLSWPGVAPRHVRVWRDRSGNWLRVLERQQVLLNSIPVSPRARARLCKGDRIFLGDASHNNELWVFCRAASGPHLSGEAGLDGRFAAESADRRESALLVSREGFEQLSRAEYDVLSWFARGVVEVEDISRLLYRSVNTIRTQLSKIYEKTGVNSRAELLGELIRGGFVIERSRRGLSLKMGDCGCSGQVAPSQKGRGAKRSKTKSAN